MFRYGQIAFGDNVRIVDDASTGRSGHAGLIGVCYGVTTPSATGVEVIGDAPDDVALNVHFEDDSVPDAWFAPELVALVDRAIGSRATAGDQVFVKQAVGDWDREQPAGAAKPKRRWLRRS